MPGAQAPQTRYPSLVPDFKVTPLFNAEYLRTVTVTTVTCSAPLQSDRWRIPEFTHSVPAWCKQHDTENSSVRSSAPLIRYSRHSALYKLLWMHETVRGTETGLQWNTDLHTSVSFRMTLSDRELFNGTQHRAISATAELLVPKGLLCRRRCKKNRDFRPISRFISETIQDRNIVTGYGTTPYSYSTV